MRRLCVFAVLILGSSSPATADEPKHRDILEAFQKQLIATASKAGPSIACVVASRSEYYPKAAGEHPGQLGSFDPKEFLKGSVTAERTKLAQSLDLSDPRTIHDHNYAGGVVIDSSGLVLTPYHAIDGATKIFVFLPRGGSYADIHAADERCDLAVLKLIQPPANLTAIKFAEVRTRDQGLEQATVMQGKLVVLLANPFHSAFQLGNPSAAFGSITNIRARLSNPERKLTTAAEKLASYYKCGTLFEHDVRVNAGVTGGALVNLDGEMLGLTTSAAVVYNRKLGPGYAIPMDVNFRRLIEVLRRGEEIEYGFLGVPLPDDTSRSIQLLGVTENGPAQLGGLREGDVITRINGQPASTFDDLMLTIGSALAGTKVKLKVRRFGEDLDLEVTLAKFKNDRPYLASRQPDPVFGLRVDYGSTRTVGGRGGMFIPQRGAPSQTIPPGVWVREVAADSPAAKRFKALGDKPEDWTVTKVNGVEVSTPGEFYKAAKGLDKVKLTLRDPHSPGRERELILP